MRELKSPCIVDIVSSHIKNDALVGSYMLLIYSFYLCSLSRELSDDEA